jgi:hypothetical protein
MADNKATVVKMVKAVDSKIDMAKAIISIICEFNSTKLTEVAHNVMAYFLVYGVNTSSKELIVNAKVCKNIATLKTVMSNLKKEGWIYRDELNSKVYVSKELNIEITPSMAFYLRIDTNK